jgi:hypothetical protein
MTWTDEMIEEMISLTRRGWSASRVAAEISKRGPAYRVTRNAVIGKAMRIGLRLGDKQALATQAKRVPPALRPKVPPAPPKSAPPPARVEAAAALRPRKHYKPSRVMLMAFGAIW